MSLASDNFCHAEKDDAYFLTVLGAPLLLLGIAWARVRISGW